MFAGVCNEKCSGGKRASDIFPAAGRRVASPLMPPHPGGVDNGFERVCALPLPARKCTSAPTALSPFQPRPFLDLLCFRVARCLGEGGGGEEEGRENDIVSN